MTILVVATVIVVMILAALAVFTGLEVNSRIQFLRRARDRHMKQDGGGMEEPGLDPDRPPPPPPTEADEPDRQ